MTPHELHTQLRRTAAWLASWAALAGALALIGHPL